MRGVHRSWLSFKGVACRTYCQRFKTVKADWGLDTPVIFIDTQHRCKKCFVFLSLSFALKTSVELLSLISWGKVLPNKLLQNKRELIPCKVYRAGGGYITFPFLNHIKSS